MKKYIKSLAWIAALAFAVVSCQEKIQPHEPGEPDVTGCYGVYFPTQAASGSHVYNPTQDPSVEITVARTNTSGAVTVPVILTTSEDGIFSLGDVSFADGQEETTAVLRFDNAVEGTTYSASLLIEGDQYASKYNSSPVALDFSVMRVEMKDFLNPVTGEPALITLNEGWWNEVHMAKMKYYEVDGVRTCTIYSVEDGGIWGDTVNATLQFNWYTKNNNGEGNNLLEVQKQYFGFDYADWASKPEGEAANPIYVYDNYWRHIEVGTSGIDQFTWMEFAKQYGDPDGSYPIGYYDGNGGFYFTLRYYIPGLGGFSSDPYEFVAIVDGYTRVDYSLEAESDYSYDGVSPISIEAGVDVASIKYAVYEGELTATQVGNKIAAIEDGTDASTEFSDFELDEEEAVKYATLQLAPETSGMYTFVAVAYDQSGKAQNNTSVVFKHIAAGDVEDHAVEVDVFTEDTPERYKSYHDYDSFAYCISGKNLTDVHVGLFTYSAVNEDPEAYTNAVKADAKGKYAVSADVLAQINGEGGYYTVASGMPANTEIMVLVWATNGDMESVAFASYKTAKLPYVWNSLGKGTLVDDFIVTLFGKDDITVACDVYEEATTPGLYMITGYQCALAAAFFGVTEDVMAPYEGGNWNNTEVVIDATDPDAVLIEQQDYGVCVNSSYGFFLIESNPEAPGTLKDGEITFPAEELYVTLPGIGKTYYTNDNGTTKIVLPASANPTAAPKAQAGGRVSDTKIAKKHLMEVERPVVKFERDPKPVKVAVKVATAARTTKVKNLDQYVPVR